VYHGIDLHEVPDPVQQLPNEGLPARGTNVSLQDHCEPPPDAAAKGGSAFRGGTQFPSSPHAAEGAAYWAKEGGYVVEIEGAPWWDANALLDGKIPTPTGFRGLLMIGEGERVIWGEVTPDGIKRIGVVKSSMIGDRLWVQWIWERR
jgi:hypothetical protein